MRAHLILILFYISGSAFCQEGDITYENVQARFVSIPDKLGAYHVGAEEYPTYEVVQLKKVWFPERDYFDWFGDVDLQDSFAIFFTGQIRIPMDGWYEFSLTSDDGSILWLDKHLLIDNDGNHPMRMKKDSSYLKADKYDFKIWYFQDYPMKMGVEFDVLPLEDLPKEVPKERVAILEPKQEKIVLDAQVLFAFGSYRLSKEGRRLIDSIGRVLNDIDGASFVIEGHTDNLGSDAHNQSLSVHRAKAVMKRFLLQNIPKVKLITKAYGPISPIADNSTEEGRSKNRRVEIKIVYNKP